MTKGMENSPDLPVSNKRIVNLLLQERRDWEQLAIAVGLAFSSVTDDMTPSTPFQKDIAWATARANETGVPFDHTIQTAVTLLRKLGIGLYEWFDSMITLLRPETLLPTQATTCLRGASELVLLGCHLADPLASTPQRLCRFSASVLSEAQTAGQILALTEETVSEGGRDPWEWQRMEIREQLAMGYEHQWTRDDSKVTGVLLNGERSNVSLKMSEVARRFIPENPEMYPVLSSSAHAHIWTAESMRNVSPEVRASIVSIQAFRFSGIFAKTLGEYFGIDTLSMRTRTQRRAQAVIANITHEQSHL